MDGFIFMFCDVSVEIPSKKDEYQLRSLENTTIPVIDEKIIRCWAVKKVLLNR